MTVEACAGDVGMVEVGGDPSHGRVAVVAIVAAIDVVGVFASGDAAVVTRAAGAYDLRVIDRVCRVETERCVTVLTGIRGLDVQRMFARRIGTIVAAEAPGADRRVIENCGYPGDTDMTEVALFSRRNVSGWLAVGCNTIVAAVTAACDCRVIHQCDRRPGRCCMAVAAGIRRRNVVRGFHRR